MRAKFLSGMLYSTFRRGRSYVQPDRRGSSAQKLWLSTRSTKACGPVSQTMPFARNDLVCQVKYFKEEIAFLNSLDTNELIKALGRKGKSEIPIKVATAIRSLAEIILDSHSMGIPLGESLRLSNLRISRSLGKFAMLEPPKHTDTWGSLLGDYGRGADVLEELARLVVGPDVQMPTMWIDFISKMREEFPNVELIIYHSLFLPLNMRYMLKVIVDQRFCKDFDSLKKDEKNAIRKFLKELGKNRSDNLQELLPRDEFLKFVSLKSRRGSKARKKSNSDLSTLEAIWSDEARDIIAINRDGVVHGCKTDLNEEERKAMPNIRRHWRTPQSVVQLLAEEFDLLEQSYLDPSYDKAKILWKVLGIPELFGETEDTWKAAVDAIAKEVEVIKAARLDRGN